MKWKLELDALIESTTTFVNEIKRGQLIADLPIALGAAERSLADTSQPISPLATIEPMVLPASERDEIQQRVGRFKAHQEKLAREREEYYLKMKARMMAAPDPPS
jgi:hypothetical protein